jgi:hypothetical protein
MGSLSHRGEACLTGASQKTSAVDLTGMPKALSLLFKLKNERASSFFPYKNKVALFLKSRESILLLSFSAVII